MITEERRAKNRKYYLANRDKWRAYHQKRYAENPEKFNSRNNLWKANNRDKVNARQRERYANNRDSIRAYMRAWRTKDLNHCLQLERAAYARNRDKILGRNAAYRQDNAVEVAARDRIYRIAHKEGRKVIRRRSLYGLSPEGYDEMLKKQDGHCAICGNTKAEKNRNFAFVIDHDHKTGQIRGLLCRNCNTLLGFAQDRGDILMAAVDYLNSRKGF